MPRYARLSITLACTAILAVAEIAGTALSSKPAEFKHLGTLCRIHVNGSGVEQRQWTTEAFTSHMFRVIAGARNGQGRNLQLRQSFFSLTGTNLNSK